MNPLFSVTLSVTHYFSHGCTKSALHLPVQFFFSDSVVLESNCYCTTVKRLINESNTTGGLRKIGRVLDRVNEVERSRKRPAINCFLSALSRTKPISRHRKLHFSSGGRSQNGTLPTKTKI